MDIVSLFDLDALAEKALDGVAYAYYSGGAGDEVTLRDNIAAFERHRLRWRVLVDVSAIDPATTLLGVPVSMPVGVAPTARHGEAHSEAELTTARAAARAGVLFTLSSLATRRLEDLGSVDGPRWYQLYAHQDRGISEDMVARAVEHGYTAIVLTVDMPVLGRREREVRGGYIWPDAAALGNYQLYLDRLGQDAVDAGMHVADMTWDDLSWLRGLSELPLVIKGIMTGEDAALACEHGADAVWVSNHGARQLDRVPATIDVLAEVVDAVDGRAEVYLDGGVRRGTDVIAALAHGARAVFLGRPCLYALAAGGEDGVVETLDLLRAELVTAMAVLGASSPAGVTSGHVRPG